MNKLYAGLLGLTLTSAVALSANAADIYPGGLKDGPAPAYVPAATWTGFYAGVNAGYGWTADGSSGDLSPSGGFGGGQIGYNWQGVPGLGSQWVLGVEADLQGAGISDGADFGNLHLENSLNWFGTVRGRIGYAFDRALVYATGGFAYGEVESKLSAAGAAIDTSETQTGYVIGGGVEYKLNPAWSLKGEYQYISLDASDLNGAGPLNAGSGDRSEIHTVRVGLNYHLGQGFDSLK